MLGAHVSAAGWYFDVLDGLVVRTRDLHADAYLCEGSIPTVYF